MISLTKKYIYYVNSKDLFQTRTLDPQNFGFGYIRHVIGGTYICSTLWWIASTADDTV